MTDIKLHYFGATWCPPCKITKPHLAAWQVFNPHVAVDKHDIDESPDLARQYGIQSVPTFVVECDGEAIGDWSGGSSMDAIEANFSSIAGGCQ